MKKMRWLVSLGVVLLVSMLLTSSIVWAAGTYRSEISITDSSGTARTGVPALVPMGISEMVTQGFLTSSGLDTRVFEGTQEQKYMVASDKIGIFIPSLGASQQRGYKFETGYSPPNTSFGFIPGTGGYVAVADDAALELGNNFKVEFQGYIDTSAGADKNIVFKDLAFKIWVSAENEMSVSIYNAGWTATVVTATGVSSGVHFVEVAADVQNLRLYVNGVLKDTEVLGGTISVPDNANNWLLMQNNAISYMKFFKIWVD